MSGQYILHGRRVVPAPDAIAWALWMARADRRVGLAVVGRVRVSTVFLGFDHGNGRAPPILFETMLFGGPSALDQRQRRYATWEQAVAGHARVVALVRRYLRRFGRQRAKTGAKTPSA